VIGLFKQKSPGNIVILLIFGLLLKLPLFLFPRNVKATAGDGALYRLLVENLPPEGWLFSFLAFVLLYVQALMVNYLVNEYRMISRQNYLPGMAYMLLTSFMPEWSYFSAPLLAATLVIWSFIKLFRLYNLPNAKPQVFNVGLITGISSYIYFPAAAFAVCILLGLMILKPFRLNEVILFLLGCLTPYYFHAVYLFLTNNLSLARFLPQVTLEVPRIRSNIPLAVSTLLLAIPFLMGGYAIQVHLRKMLIQVRKNWSIVVLYLLLAFFVPFINSQQSFHTWVLVVAPFALFHACAYFYQRRGWVAMALFVLTTGYVLYMQYGTKTWH